MFVFLDVDGVLNKESDWSKPTIDSNCVRNLAKALEGIEAKIILTSSWRKGFLTWFNPENTPQIQMFESALYKENLIIKGILPKENKDRGILIQDFLSKHPGEYIIIDDDINEYAVKPENLYLINSKTGLTEKDAKIINKRLRGK